MNMLNQQDYDAIKVYVSNGHALHPEYAAKLLESFAELHAALDHTLEHGMTCQEYSTLAELHYNSDGSPKLVL